MLEFAAGNAMMHANAMSEKPAEHSSDNLVSLDLSPFSRADIDKIVKLGEKQRLLYRWFRSERVTQAGRDQYMIYSGARGRTPYAAYRVVRHRDGHYELANHRSGATIVSGRTIDEVIDRLPDDFFYSE